MQSVFTGLQEIMTVAENPPPSLRSHLSASSCVRPAQVHVCVTRASPCVCSFGDFCFSTGVQGGPRPKRSVTDTKNKSIPYHP